MFDDDKSIKNVADAYRQMNEDVAVPHGKTAILSHPDEVSGITVLADGTRCYWTEGRNNEMVVKKPDGQIITIDCGYTSGEEKKLLDTELKTEENADIHRAMTAAEEREWEEAYHGR